MKKIGLLIILNILISELLLILVFPRNIYSPLNRDIARVFFPILIVIIIPIISLLLSSLIAMTQSKSNDFKIRIKKLFITFSSFLYPIPLIYIIGMSIYKYQTFSVRPKFIASGNFMISLFICLIVGLIFFTNNSDFEK